MRDAAHRRIALIAAVGLVIGASAPRADAQTPRGAEAQVLERAIRLLPARPDVPVRLIDPELTPDPDAVRRLDAFLVREADGRPRRVIYLNSRAAMFEKAMAGADLDVAILAAVIHHEMAHLRGAEEPEARRDEREFFQRLVFSGRVEPEEGLRYLAALTQRGPQPTGHR
jgi:hypothetical protein